MHTGWVVEDLKAPAQWLQEILVTAFPDLSVHHADSLATARKLARLHPPDIALIDLGLPDGSGVELIRELAPRRCQCVVTTIYADDHHLFPALRAGACGYLDRKSVV